MGWISWGMAPATEAQQMLVATKVYLIHPIPALTLLGIFGLFMVGQWVVDGAVGLA
jgi:hypothetical protein